LKIHPQDGRSWAIIKAIVWDIPLYADLQPDLQLVLKNLDLGKLITSDPIAATQAMIVAAGQLPYCPDDEIRGQLEIGWLDLVRHYSTEFEKGGGVKDQVNNHNVVAILLECALGLAMELNDARATSRAWGRLLLQMLNVAPGLAHYLSYAMLKRVFETPASQLHGIFPVLLAIRALSKEPL
jgi:hypothetical protein